MPEGAVLPFVVFGAAVVCFLTFLNTDFALVVLILSMLLSPELQSGAVSGRAVVIRAEDLLIIVIFLTWFAKKVINKETGLFRANSLNTPIAVYTLVVSAATLWGMIRGGVNPLRGAFYLLKYIEYFMLFFMVTNSIRSTRQIRVFMLVMFVTAAIVVFYGLATLPTYGRATAPFENVAEGGEPNTLGGYLVLICALAAGLWVYSTNILTTGILSGLVALCGYGLLQTLSRGSYLGAIAMVVSLAVLATRKKILLAGVIAFAVITGWTMLPKRVIDRVEETFIAERTYEPLAGMRIGLDESASSRIETWKSVFERWKSSPLIGHGVTGVGFIDTQYALVLGESGILGLMAFLWMITALLRAGMRSFRRVPDGYLRGVALGFTAGAIGLLVHSFSAATFIIIRIMEPFWFMAAIIVALPGVSAAEENNPYLSYADSDGTEHLSADHPQHPL